MSYHAVQTGFQATPALLAKATNMKVIGRAGVGIDNIDVAEATRKGVLVMNTPGGNTVSTAQLAISLLCSAARCDAVSDWQPRCWFGVVLWRPGIGIAG